ncbi:MAG: UDP-N-acetylmuramoyl-L-alanyl-D-glutamate--2,6-diaminopimelate ligase [Firmicutes bacterium]|nr:UDP-N-acetylmuramoyl-L-alanyl-D-glutamate--2,6-diaminopimelate ligase [Bacillota bacterium]
MKLLSELYSGYPDIEIRGIKINSKQVEVGDIFVCTMGVTADRHEFIDEAISNGASAVVVSRDVECSVPTIKVENTNLELRKLASKFYDYPEKELSLIATTGTNGKTTTSQIIQDLIGDNICGYMGTNGIICSKFSEKIVNTTPDFDRLFMYFRRFLDSGCKILSMETSSEAYFRKRLDDVYFDVGIVTNITEDHLNIHKTVENYVACKKEMLEHIKEHGYAILNTEDKYFDEFYNSCSCNVLTYGMNNADLLIKDIEVNSKNTNFILNYKDKDYSITSPLLGDFNVYNLVAGIGACIALGYDIEDIISKVSNIKVLEGRVQFLEYGQNYDIVLDYAHTTDSFLKLYPVLKKICKGRIITVTGSAGGREKEKRGPMGKVVLDNSDYVIFTMDDPRNEDVNSIIDDLVSLSDKTNYLRIIDRKEAIFKAFDMANDNDLVLVAGKGCDNYMALGNRYLPYCDKEVIDEYFNK